MTSDDYIADRKFDREYLLKHGFRFRRDYSDEDEYAYTYRFPVYKYNITILLECEVIVFLPSNSVQVNVFDRGSHDVYARWYDPSCKHEPILDIIENNMNKEFKKIGIVKKNDDNCGRQNVSELPTRRRSKRKPKIKDSDNLQ